MVKFGKTGIFAQAVFNRMFHFYHSHLIMKNSYVYLLIFFLTSCYSQTYIQEYNIHSDDVVFTNNNLAYENDDCELNYSFDDGSMRISVINKTDKNLYLDMTKSAFIRNSESFNYYSGITLIYPSREYNVSFKKDSIKETFLYQKQVLPIKHNGSLKEIYVADVPMICIPPKAYVTLNRFNIFYNFNIQYSKELEMRPKEVSEILYFEENNSPLSFRNRIAYSVGDKATEINYIDNLFFVRSIQNVAEQFYKKRYSPNIYFNSYTVDDVKSGTDPLYW